MTVLHARTLPLTAAEAAALVAAFSSPASATPDERAYEQQVIDTMKAVARGSWQDVQAALSRLYAFAWKPAFGQLRLMDHCEGTLLPALAKALGRDEDALRDELREGKLAFASREPRPPAPFVEPPLSPPLDLEEEYEGLFPIAVTGELAFCESPGAPERLARITVTPGTWHSYARRADDSTELYLVHERTLADGAATLAEAYWTKAGEIVSTVGTGMINILDRAALADTWTLDRMLYLPGEREHRGRAMSIGTEGWKGPLPIFVAGPDRIKIVID